MSYETALRAAVCPHAQTQVSSSTPIVPLQLFCKQPVFKADRELEQLEAISRICGTPNPATWPTVVECALYGTMKPKRLYPRTLRDHFNGSVRTPPPPLPPTHRHRHIDAFLLIMC